MEFPSSASRSAPGSWTRLARLARKELRETLRDRRTIGTLVLMPLLVYPLLNVAFQKFLLSNAGAIGPSVYHVGVESEEQARTLAGYLLWGEQLLAQEPRGDTGTTPERRGGEPLRLPSIEFAIGSQLERNVREMNLDLAVRVDTTPRREGVREETIDCQIIYRKNSPTSEAALRYLEERLRSVNEHWLAALLDRHRLGPMHLAEFDRQPVEGGDSPGFSLATLAPLILILMTVTGAVYPAIDLTAGERERGTLETLIAAPIPRMSLLLAKYVAVMVVALLTATVNFLAMTATIVSGGLGPSLFGEEGLRLATIVQVFGLTIIFAAFFSAVLLAITSFARSFKEAQAYLIPLTLVSLAPGFLAFTPGLELNGVLAVAPLVNIVLVARDMFQGGAEPWWMVVAITSTALYAVGALAIASRVFGAHAVLFGSEEGWSALFRRPAHRRPTASLGNALACLAVLAPSYVLLSSWLAQFRSAPLSTRLLGAAAVTSLLFGVIPLLAAYLGRVRLRDGFAWRGASIGGYLGAAILGVSLWPFAHELFLVNEWLGLVSLDAEKLQPAVRLVRQLPDVSPWLVLLALAISPAVFEELFFRGYLFGAIQTNTSAARTVLLTAFLFGAFHVFAAVLAVERFLPSAFLGLALGWVRWRTASVWPGIVLHALHNGLLLMAAYYQDELAARGWGLQEQSHMPASWLLTAGMGAAVGLAAVHFGARASKRRQPPADDHPPNGG